MLVHVGDDFNPSVFNSDGSYDIHLLPEHHDPDLDNLTYGDWTHRTHAFGTLEPEDVVFFNFKFDDGGWYITSYFWLKEILDGFKVLEVQDKVPYKHNAHVVRGDLEDWTARSDFRMMVGDPGQSIPRFKKPLIIDEALWRTIELCDKSSIPFTEQRKKRKCSVSRINGSFLRMPKPLTHKQVFAIAWLERFGKCSREAA